MADFPPIMKKAAVLLASGIIILACSLVVSTPISYLLTIGLGSGCLGLGLLGYLVWFLEQLKEPN